MSSSEIIELAARWGTNPRTLSCVSEAANRIYRCESADGFLYLRVTTTAGRALELVAAAVDWQRQLHDAGAPIVQPLLSGDGFWVETTSNGEFIATATRAAPGRPVAFSNVADIASWAEAVGRLHTASERFAASPVSTRTGMISGHLPTLVELWRQIAPVVADDPVLHERYAEGTDFLTRQTQPMLVTHGDVRPGNALVSEGSVLLLDFGEPTWAWAPYDLARMMLDDDARPPADRDRHWSAILKGYRRGHRSTTILETDVERFLRIRVMLMHAWSLQDPTATAANWLSQLRFLC